MYFRSCLAACALILAVAQQVSAQVTYCTPPTMCPSSYPVYIAGVKFNSLSTTSGCDGYRLFPETGSSTTTVERGTSYMMTVKFYGYYIALWGPDYYDQGATAYIDFNGDGDFDDESEKTGASKGSDAFTIGSMIPIPANARIGKTRMRIRHIPAQEGADAMTACNNMTSKMAYDIEDYTITITERNTGVPSCPVTFTPANNSANVPRNPGLKFTWTGASGGTNTTFDFYLGTSPTALTAIATNIVSPDGYTGSYTHPDFLNPNTTYYYKVATKNEHGINTGCTVQKFTTVPNTNDLYCTPSSLGGCSLPTNYYIASVRFNTINNVTTCPGTTTSYMHYPVSGTTTTSVTKGQTYTLTVDINIPCNNGRIMTWIDFNRDGIFNDDASERFVLLMNDPHPCSDAAVSLPVAIPVSAVTGNTRMRIRLFDYTEPLHGSMSCYDIFDGGETEDYTITIVQPNGCTSLTASYTKTDNAAANGSAGSITITPSGGTPGYSVLWNDPSVTGFTPGGLQAGIYYATVTDAAGCSYTTPPINIYTPPTLKIDGITAVNPTCVSGGNIRVDVSGGIGPYTFSWTDHQEFSGNFVNDLAEGTYSVVVTDSKGTQVTSNAVTIKDFSVTYTVTDALCAFGGHGAGRIDLTTMGGLEPYTYQWKNLDPEKYFYPGNSPSNLTEPGTYTVTVTDAAGCTRTIPEMIVHGPPFVALSKKIVPPNCNGNGSTTGEIWLEASNGVAPYRYEVYGSDGTGIPLSLPYEEDENGFRFTNVPADKYYGVTAYDANGCASAFTPENNAIYIRSLQELDPFYNNMTVCSGQPANVTYTGNRDLPADTEYIWFEDAEGNIPLYIGAVFIAPATSDIITYYLANYQGGCHTSIIPFTVYRTLPMDKPVITPVTEQGTIVLCEGGSVSLSAPEYFPVYQWSNGATTQTVTITEPGTISVHVKDYYECKSPESDLVTIIMEEQPATPVITVEGNTSFCEGGYVSLSAPDGYKTYKWSTGLPNGADTQRIYADHTGTYSVIVGNACESLPSAGVEITAFPLPDNPVSVELINGNVLKVTGTSTTYEWRNNDQVLPFEGSQLTVTESGIYSVYSKNEDCLSAEGLEYRVNFTGVEDPLHKVFTIYPNPSSGRFTILTSDKTITEANISVINTLGESLSTGTLTFSADSSVLDLTPFPAGLYRLSIRYREQIIVTTVVVR